MRNPFKPATQQAVRCKLFVYGATGTGKTRLALGFPALAVADLERGTVPYAGRYPFDVLPVTGLAEADAALAFLASGQHAYKTFVIDPFTVLNEMILFTCNKAGVERLTFQDWDRIKLKLKKFMIRLLALDMNIVVTAREKALYAEGETMRKIGTTWDGDKSLASYFDTVAHLTTREDGTRITVIEKDRWERLKQREIPTDYVHIREAFGPALERAADPVDLDAAERAADGGGSAPVQPQQAKPPVAKPTPEPSTLDPAEAKKRSDLAEILRCKWSEQKATRQIVFTELQAAGVTSVPVRHGKPDLLAIPSEVLARCLNGSTTEVPL